MFSFDLLRIDLLTFFPAFLSTRLSQSYIHDRRVCELTWFNCFFCLFFFKFFFSVLSFNIRLFDSPNGL
jgi:hypothetical protein